MSPPPDKGSDQDIDMVSSVVLAATSVSDSPNSAGTLDIVSKYRTLKRRYAELEEKHKETTSESQRSDERNVKMRDERKDRILELESQPGFTIPDGTPSSPPLSAPQSSGQSPHSPTPLPDSSGLSRTLLEQKIGSPALGNSQQDELSPLHLDGVTPEPINGVPSHRILSISHIFDGESTEPLHRGQLAMSLLVSPEAHCCKGSMQHLGTDLQASSAGYEPSSTITQPSSDDSPAMVGRSSPTCRPQPSPTSASTRRSPPRPRRSARVASSKISTQQSAKPSTPTSLPRTSRRSAATTSPASSTQVDARQGDEPRDNHLVSTDGKRESDAAQPDMSSDRVRGVGMVGLTGSSMSNPPRSHAPPPPSGQALTVLLSSSATSMQIDPALMGTTGLKNVIGMGAGESAITNPKKVERLNMDASTSGAQPSASTSTGAMDSSSNPPSTSPATSTSLASASASSPSSATPSSGINPYSLLYGAMSPLSAIPTTPSSATPTTPTLPYPNLFYPYPFAVSPGLFVPSSGLLPTTAQQPSQMQQPQRQPSDQLPRQNKPKRLKAHTVTTKSFSIPMVPRDKMGKPMLPLNVGIMTVISLGEVCMREHFHTERYIFPVGYEVTRRYLSTIDSSREVVYHCTILDGGDGPKFQIVPSDTADRPVIAGTATGAWSSIVKQANAIRNRQHSNSVSGPDFFGLGQNTIKHLIQELPNANRLRDYVWQNFVEGGPLGGRHAAVIPALPEDYDAAHPIGPYYPSIHERMRQAGQSNTGPATEGNRSYYPPHVTQESSAQASGSSSENDRGSSGGPSPSPGPSTTSRGKRKASANSQRNAPPPAGAPPRQAPSHLNPQYLPGSNPSTAPSIPAPFATIMNAYPTAHATASQGNSNIGQQ